MTEIKEEKRKVVRTEYKVNGVLVVCASHKAIYVDVINVSPLGVGMLVKEADIKGLPDQDVVLVADTLIMFAKITHIQKRDDGLYEVGIHAKKFTEKVFNYLILSVIDHVDELD